MQCHSNLTIEGTNLTDSDFIDHADLFGTDVNGTFCNNSNIEGTSTILFLDRPTIGTVSVCLLLSSSPPLIYSDGFLSGF